jgi:hypothetical protein
VAVVAASLTVGMPARAQDSGHIPSPVGAARTLPEPLPCGPAPSCQPPPPNLIPGPISPQAAPMGPADCLSLPGDHSSAFQCENCVEDSYLYFGSGMTWLARQRLGAGGIAVFDPGLRGSGIPVSDLVNDPTFDQTVRSVLPLLSPTQQTQVRNLAADVGQSLNAPLRVFLDAVNANPVAKSGLPALPNSPLAEQFNNLVPRMAPGINGTIGWLWGDVAFEYTGYYIFQNDRSIHTTSPAGIDVFFYNPPPGFEGARGSMWLQADRLATTFGSYLWNNEFNFRMWDKAIQGWELLLGVRYLEQRERLSIFTDDSGGSSDLTQMATYTSQTFNHIVAPQVGAEYSVPLIGRFILGLSGKVALGANFADTRVTLMRADGYTGFDTTHSQTAFSQIYEMGAYTEYSILQRLRFRVGYNAMWLLGIGTAVDQVDFNLRGNPNFPNSGLPAVTDHQSALRNFLVNQLRLGETNGATPEQIRLEQHGMNNFSGSVFYHGPTFELEFLF